MPDYGATALIPTATVLALAIVTRRTVESLIGGVIVGLIILDHNRLVPALADVALAVMADETVRWIILVCGLLGSVIAILSACGAAGAFGNVAARFVDNKRKSLIATWLLGILIFVDDYFNALVVSSSMGHVTKRYGVSKPMLAYVVDSTAAPVSLLVPISTWAVFFSALIEGNGLAPSGEGLALYVTAIPYMFYPWFAVLLVLAVSLGWFPVIGPMKKFEAKAVAEIETPTERTDTEKQRANIWTFAVPMFSLVGFTVWFDLDIFQGVIAAMFVTIALVLGQRAMSATKLFDSAMSGFAVMLMPLATVVSGFMLKEVNDSLGLTQYVVGLVEPIMTAASFPVVCFLTLGFLSFATSSSWGLFIVAFPIVIPVAQAIGADMPLVLGALLSASCFGSHACFYSDATVLAAQGSGCTPMEHALTQFPFALSAAAVAAIMFVVVAY